MALKPSLRPFCAKPKACEFNYQTAVDISNAKGRFCPRPGQCPAGSLGIVLTSLLAAAACSNTGKTKHHRSQLSKSDFMQPNMRCLESMDTARFRWHAVTTAKTAELCTSPETRKVRLSHACEQPVSGLMSCDMKSQDTLSRLLLQSCQSCRCRTA